MVAVDVGQGICQPVHLRMNCRRLTAAIINLAVAEYVTAVGYEHNYESARDFLRGEWGAFLLEQMGRDPKEAWRHFRHLRQRYWHLVTERDGAGLLRYCKTYFPRRLNSIGMLASSFEIGGRWRSSYEIQCVYGISAESIDKACRHGVFKPAFQVDVARGKWWILPVTQFERWFVCYKRDRWQGTLHEYLGNKGD